MHGGKRANTMYLGKKLCLRLFFFFLLGSAIWRLTLSGGFTVIVCKPVRRGLEARGAWHWKQKHMKGKKCVPWGSVKLFLLVGKIFVLCFILLVV